LIECAGAGMGVVKDGGMWTSGTKNCRQGRQDWYAEGHNSMA